MIWKKWNVCEPCCIPIECPDCPPGSKLIRNRAPAATVSGFAASYYARSYITITRHKFHPANFCYTDYSEELRDLWVDGLDGFNKTTLLSLQTELTQQEIQDILNAPFPPEDCPQQYLDPWGGTSNATEVNFTMRWKTYIRRWRVSPRQDILPDYNIVDVDTDETTNYTSGYLPTPFIPLLPQNQSPNTQPIYLQYCCTDDYPTVCEPQDYVQNYSSGDYPWADRNETEILGPGCDGTDTAQYDQQKLGIQASISYVHDYDVHTMP